MSATLYTRVRSLYELLDLDGNGGLDREEARLGFSTCFADVHRSPNPQAGDKQQIVEQQVKKQLASGRACCSERSWLDCSCSAS